MKKRFTFLLNFGYAESQGLAFVPFRSRDEFAYAKHALCALATYLKTHFLKKAVKKKCCEASFKKDSSAVFCSTCGWRIKKDNDFDGEAFMEWVESFAACDFDTFAADFIKYDEDAEWEVGDLSDLKDARIVYTAEKVLAAAIGHSPDKRRFFEEILKDRDDKNFSFWSQ